MKVYSIRTGKEITELQQKTLTKRDAVHKLLDAEESLRALGMEEAASQVTTALNTILEPMTEEEFNEAI